MRRLAGYVLVYVLWAVTIVAGAVVAWVARSAWLMTIVITSLKSIEGDQRALFYQSMQIRAVDVWSIFLIGLVLVILVVFVEYYYRTGFQQGKLLAHFCLMSIIEAGVLFLSHSIYFVLGKAAGLLSWSSVALPLIELLVTALFAWLYIKQVKAPIHMPLQG